MEATERTRQAPYCRYRPADPLLLAVPSGTALLVLILVTLSSVGRENKMAPRVHARPGKRVQGRVSKYFVVTCAGAPLARDSPDHPSLTRFHRAPRCYRSAIARFRSRQLHGQQRNPMRTYKNVPWDLRLSGTSSSLVHLDLNRGPSECGRRPRSARRHRTSRKEHFSASTFRTVGIRIPGHHGPCVHQPAESQEHREGDQR
jgi:hypothetical protein